VLITPVCGSRFTFKLDMRAVMLTSVWHTTADRTGLTLCTLQTEGEKKMRKRKIRKRGVIRSIIFITGGNGTVYFSQCPQGLLLVCPVKLGWSLHLTDGKTGTAW